MTATAPESAPHAAAHLFLLGDSGGIEVGTLVSWQASNAEGAPLRYSVLYSADNEQSGWPVATDIEETSLTITAGRLHDIPGSNQGVIKVIATDGINTGEDVSDRALTAPNTPPDIMLAHSGETIFLRPGALLVLNGSATDVEDGVVPDGDLRWWSSQDGDLGAGRELATHALSKGKHTITLTATDSQGAAAQKTVTVVVTDTRVFLPLIVR